MSSNPSFRDGVQFAWDSTSLGLAQACLRKYYYRMILNITPEDTSVHLVFGVIYAKALETFYLRRAEGASIDEALRIAVQLALVESWSHERNSEGERILGTGQPVSFNHQSKTRMNLVRSLVWYVDQFGEESPDGLQTYHLQSGKAAVELSFALPLADGLLYCGHLDRVVTYAGHLYWMDQKAQPLDSTVLTPTGFLPIREIVPGTPVMGVDGAIYTVEGVYPKGKTTCYLVTTNDGVSVLAAGDHLWKVREPQTKWRTITTPELIGKKWELPVLAPMQFPRADLPLHPYALGLLLGDGYLAGHSIQFSDQNGVEAARLSQYIGTDKIKPASIYNNSWTISGGKTLQAIRDLGLFGALSADKFIPHSYLYADIEQRSALLRGLIETDGCKNKNSQLYDTTSEQLAKDICQLARSLGNTARYRTRSDGAFRCTLFGPSFGHYARNPRIVSVVQVEDTETACIKVSAPDHLYITDNYIPTHNTTGSTVSPHFFDGFSPDNQFSGYTWAGQIILKSPVKGGIVDAAQIAQGFTRFERGFVTRTTDQLNEWLDGTFYTIELTQQATREQHFPMNLTACGNYGGCPYRQLCARSPSVRDAFIKSNFQVQEPWSPITPR